MIEKAATRILDQGEPMSRQAGRGRFLVVRGPDKGESIAIAELSMTVGSGPDSEVVLTDPTISRKHLVIEPGTDGVVLRDLGSTNGSFVQGARFQELTLGFGTEVTIGQTVLKYVPHEERLDVPPSDEETYGGLAARDPKLRKLFRLLADVASSEATVLIEGETGTGKELFAEEIHRHSGRRDGPFVVFDCGAVPKELIESALFGHLRGAFTGAVTDRPGAFEEADGGTLFLDEIGELAPEVQPTLLRALDKRAVRPVGGTTYRQVSVRVVAATNRNLRVEIAAKRFREDLYYRLAVVRMHVPPLRERPDDVPLLVEHFAKHFSGGRSFELAAGELERLRHHTWPGNVRELRNVIERACALTHGTKLEIDEAFDERVGGGATAGTVSIDLPFQRGQGTNHRQLRARVRPRAARPPRGQPIGGGADLGGRPQALPRALAQARPARIERVARDAATRRTAPAPCPTAACPRVGTGVDFVDMGLLADLRRRALTLTKELTDNVADSGHAAVYLRQLLRGNRGSRPHVATDDEVARAPTGPPVLLIHGYLATRGSLHLLEGHLARRGHVVMSFRFGPINLGDIRDSAGLIARKVESIIAQTGVTHVDIVGHSMGGLVGLYYVKRLGGRHRVRRLVLLGTPAQGTWSALFGLVTAPLGLASLQLLPGSPFLRELAETPLPAGVDVVSVGALRDWLAPVASTALEGVRHISLPTGHSGLLVDDEVAELVAGLLRAPSG